MTTVTHVAAYQADLIFYQPDRLHDAPLLNVQLAQYAFPQANVDLLIGMDIISQGELKIVGKQWYLSL